MGNETGTFSERRLSKSLLKQILRKVFLEDWLVKLVALAVTFALWLGVTGLSTPTTTRLSGVPLTLRFSSNTEITNSPVQEVDIVITGDKRRVNQINKNDLIVSVDLTDVAPGDRVIQLKPETVSLSLPTGVKLDEVQPNRIAVRLESVEEKEIGVEVKTTGAVAEGSEIYGMASVPTKVRVRGPAGFVRSLSTVSTEDVDIGGRDSDFIARQVPLILANPKATVLETPTVDVGFRIGEKRMERLLLVPLNDASGKRATVVLFGPRSLLIGIQASDLKIERQTDADAETPPKLTLPASLQDSVEIRQIKVN